MKKDLTELVFILDRSGSMGGLESDTIGGFNSMLEKQREEEGECVITTVLFDDRYELLHDRIDIKAVKDITEKEYFVRGCTALLDAVGRTISKIKNVQDSVSEEFKASKVMFVIITDGLENASREYRLNQVKNMIESQKRENWQFVFLGANIDSVKAAGSMGIDIDMAMDYVPDSIGVRANYRVMGSVLSSYRKSGIVDKEAFEEIRDDMKKRGKK